MSDKKQVPEISDHAIESFVRCILPARQEYFESEEGQREFVEWREHKERIEAKLKSHRVS